MQIPTSHFVKVSAFGSRSRNATRYSAKQRITVFFRPSLSEIDPWTSRPRPLRSAIVPRPPAATALSSLATSSPIGTACPMIMRPAAAPKK